MEKRRRPAVNLTIERELFEWLEVESKKERRSLSNFIEWLVAQEMERRGDGEPTEPRPEGSE